MLRTILQLHLSSENGHFKDFVGLGGRIRKRPPGAGKDQNPPKSSIFDFFAMFRHLELSDGPDTSPGWSTHEYYRLREFQSVRTKNLRKN